MVSIYDLPSEIILIIFKNLSYPDSVRFGGTCRRFNELVKSYQILWKSYSTKMIHPDIVRQKTGCSTDWLVVFSKHMALKKKFVKYLDKMSSVHYNNYEPVDVNDCRHFCLAALADESSLGESIYILQQFIRYGNDCLNSQCIEKPYSLTTVYYAKTVLRYLFQLYLVYVWEKKYVPDKEAPVNVVNFFVQWVDPLNIYPQSEVMAHLQLLVNRVKKEMLKRYPRIVKDDPNLEDRQTLLLLNDDQIVKAISSVIYGQRYINLTPHTTLTTLDIVKVIQNRCGCIVATGVIYQYLAQHFGLQCNLIVIPNHFILELNKRNDTTQVYKISLDTGECLPKRRCPFTTSFVPSGGYTYSPVPLIHYISNEFISSMGGVRDWYTANVENILEMTSRGSRERGDYPFLNLQINLEGHDVSELQHNFNYFEMEPKQLFLLQRFSLIENPRPPRKRSVTVKTRTPALKYAVGMICFHRLYHYVCLIIEWDTTCYHTRYNRNEIRNLQFGVKQPFYHVIAMDQSFRYVPQENLVEYNRPNRLFHLEDAVARGFSHFNGFAYEPNDEKAKEYPEDTAISNFFKTHNMVLNDLRF